MQNILMNLAFYLRLLLPAPAFPATGGQQPSSRRTAFTMVGRFHQLCRRFPGHAGHGAGLSRPLACHGICFRVPARFHGQAVF